MLQIQHITDDAFQQQTVTLEDGSSFTFTLYFRPLQQAWFITNFTYQDFTLTELKVCVSPNMLFQFQNQLPFGLACFSAGNREPQLQQDFSSGAAKLFVLTKAQVTAYSEFIKTGVLPA